MSMEWLRFAIDYGVIAILVIMSVVAVSVAIERKIYYGRIRIETFDNKKELELVLTRRLHFISTVGSNAPYIGLLGTVLGIMLTFSTIGAKGLVDTGQIMTGLALALKATAIGLLVAIPAVVMYNFLLRAARELIMEWEIRNGRQGL
jgi:biopolymer transport protein ExbB